MYRAGCNVLLALLVGSAAVMGSATGCSNPTAKSAGSLEIVVSAPRVLSATSGSSSQSAVTGVDHVTVSITGDEIPVAIVETLVDSSGRYGGSFPGLPDSTNVSVTASAYDANGNVVYQGTTSGLTITSDTPELVAIVLQDQNASAAYDSGAPVIDGVIAAATTVAPSATDGLRVRAHDNYTDFPVTYSWTASAGSFDDSTAVAPVWTAPSSDQTVTITITVSDTQGETAVASFPITVVSTTGNATVDATFNSWPTVSAMSALPSRIDLSGTTVLGVTASDADGDTLSYSWSTDCGGHFDSSTSATPSFTLTALGSGSCAFSVTVSDGRGGTNSGQYVIETGPAPSVTVAPPG
jgi:hypothetical protein